MQHLGCQGSPTLRKTQGDEPCRGSTYHQRHAQKLFYQCSNDDQADNNEVLEAYPSLFKPSGTDSMLLGSSPVFLLRSPVFIRGTEQLAFSLLVIMSGGTGNSGERSRSQMRVGFVFDTLTGGYVSGVETGNVTQKSTCSHAMRIMEEASWSGQV